MMMMIMIDGEVVLGFVAGGWVMCLCIKGASFRLRKGRCMPVCRSSPMSRKKGFFLFVSFDSIKEGSPSNRS